MNPASGLIASPVASPFYESKKMFAVQMTKRRIAMSRVEVFYGGGCVAHLYG